MKQDLQALLDQYVSVPQVAEALGAERWFAYDLVHSGQLPAQKAGHNWLVKRSDAIDLCGARAAELRSKAKQYEDAMDRLAA